MTKRIDFYILAQSELAGKYNYACRVTNKAYNRGLKVYLLTDDPVQSQLLDKMLWTFSQGSFVPHVVSDRAPQDIHRYPVQIGCNSAPDNCLDLLISLKQEVPADYARFSRIAEFSSGEETDKSLSRQRFRFYREQGIEPRIHNV